VDENQKLIAMVSKLNRATQEGVLVWKRRSAPDSIVAGNDDHIANFYGATWRTRNFGLYEERYRSWIDEDSFSWGSRLRLGLFDGSWELEYQFPGIAGIGELMESVQYQTAKVDQAVDTILNDFDFDDEKPQADAEK
jgi:hypothetical protein